MFKHFVLIVSCFLLAACSENYAGNAVSDKVPSQANDDFTLASAQSAVVPDATPENELTFVRSESIAGIKLSMTPQQFAEQLPCAVAKGEPVLWAGMGEIIQEWNYADCGLKLQLSAKDNNTPPTVSSIKVVAPSTFKTHRNIGIGSDFQQVLDAYGEYADDADNQAGETFIAGSIYGGLFISFEDNRVTSLFLGAGAE